MTGAVFRSKVIPLAEAGQIGREQDIELAKEQIGGRHGGRSQEICPPLVTVAIHDIGFPQQAHHPAQARLKDRKLVGARFRHLRTNLPVLHCTAGSRIGCVTAFVSSVFCRRKGQPAFTS